jgi:hypothetical protein
VIGAVTAAGSGHAEVSTCHGPAVWRVDAAVLVDAPAVVDGAAPVATVVCPVVVCAVVVDGFVVAAGACVEELEQAVNTAASPTSTTAVRQVNPIDPPPFAGRG